MVRLTKVLFALSPVIFFLIGYATGYPVGYGAAEVEATRQALEAHHEQ